jgi:hypothetical protein
MTNVALVVWVLHSVRNDSQKIVNHSQEQDVISPPTTFTKFYIKCFVQFINAFAMIAFYSQIGGRDETDFNGDDCYHGIAMLCNGIAVGCTSQRTDCDGQGSKWITTDIG